MASAAMMATYQKALERAHHDGLVIVGRGTRKSDGAHVVYVTSSSKAGAYEVTVTATEMICNCPARGYCKHRAIVREDMAKRLAAKLEAERIAAEKALAAPKHREPVRGYSDTRPFSLFK